MKSWLSKFKANSAVFKTNGTLGPHIETDPTKKVEKDTNPTKVDDATAISKSSEFVKDSRFKYDTDNNLVGVEGLNDRSTEGLNRWTQETGEYFTDPEKMRQFNESTAEFQTGANGNVTRFTDSFGETTRAPNSGYTAKQLAKGSSTPSPVHEWYAANVKSKQAHNDKSASLHRMQQTAKDYQDAGGFVISEKVAKARKLAAEKNS